MTSTWLSTRQPKLFSVNLREFLTSSKGSNLRHHGPCWDWRRDLPRGLKSNKFLPSNWRTSSSSASKDGFTWWQIFCVGARLWPTKDRSDGCVARPKKTGAEGENPETKQGQVLLAAAVVEQMIFPLLTPERLRVRFPVAPTYYLVLFSFLSLLCHLATEYFNYAFTPTLNKSESNIFWIRAGWRYWSHVKKQKLAMRQF